MAASSETRAESAAGRADNGRLGATIASGPGVLAALGGVVLVAGTQGGYFPTAWGPSAVVLLTLAALWLVAGGRTDVGGADLLFLGLLAAVLVWTALSLTWSDAPAQTALEIQRDVVLVAGVTVVLVLAAAWAYGHVAFALLTGITLVSGYGLATRLFPDEIGLYRPLAGYRLSEPIGYWNGLGVLGVTGALLGLGIATEARPRWQRIAASIALVVLLPTVYFTFSRGAWFALAMGTGVLFCVSARRLATAGALALLLPAPALAVLASTRADALTQQRVALPEAIDDGRRLAIVLVGLAVLAAAASIVVIVTEGRTRLSARPRRVLGAALIAAPLVVLVVVVARLGGPVAAVDRGYDAFAAPPAVTGSDLNGRFFSLSGNGRIDLWRVALTTYSENPGVGTGAGTFERSWQRNERSTFKARDAHSLYLETLAELGPAGLALLLAAVGVPVAACIGARKAPVVPAALAAFVAFLIHAGFDWDWELPGVTLAGLLAGCVGLIARRRTPARSLPLPGRIGVGAAAVFVGVLMTAGYVGSSALERAELALNDGQAAKAITEARRAERWMPWSPRPSTVQGEALLARADTRGARAAFREAIRYDDGYWRAWLGLAVSSEGRQRSVALRRARELYPRSAEIAETVRLLRAREAS